MSKSSYIPKTELETILIEYPNQNWDWYQLSMNPNITLDLIIEYLDLSWDWIGVSQNPNLTKNKLDQLRDKGIYLNTGMLVSNPNLYLYIKDMLDNGDSNQINWRSLSMNSSLEIDIITRYKDQDLDWFLISLYANIKTIDLDNNPDLPWKYDQLSLNRNLNINIEYIKKNLDKNWNWYYLSHHKRIHITDILENPELKWSIVGLSQHPDLTPIVIERYSDYHWNINYICAGANFSISYLIEKYDDRLNMFHVSKNPSLTYEDLLESNWMGSPRRKWDHHSIIHHKNFGMDIIEKIYLKDGNFSNEIWWNAVSYNPNINLDFIDKYIDKTDFNMLSLNLFGFNQDQSPYSYSSLRKEMCHSELNKFKQELIEKTWHPTRLFKWCLEYDYT